MWLSFETSLMINNLSITTTPISLTLRILLSVYLCILSFCLSVCQSVKSVSQSVSLSVSTVYTYYNGIHWTCKVSKDTLYVGDK